MSWGKCLQVEVDAREEAGPGMLGMLMGSPGLWSDLIEAVRAQDSSGRGAFRVTERQVQGERLECADCIREWQTAS